MKIIFERQKCIGCGTCQALCSKYWFLEEDGKVSLKNAKENYKTGNQELELKEVGCNQEAADSCPVQCIHIIKS